jgi:alpha-ribazole phosphatase/probable phosphoglycerate mutase
MEYLAERLRLTRIKAIYSSDLKRSVLGAQIIGRHHDVPIRPLRELREMSFGEWEGMTLQEIHEQFPVELEKRKSDLIHFSPPGDSESVGQLSERVLPRLKKIVEEEKENDILIVGHGAVNRVILSEALGLELNQMFRLQQDYGCLNIVDYHVDMPLVRLING